MKTKKIYSGFRLIDGTGADPVHNAWMVVENKKIISVGKAENYPGADSIAGVEIVDLNGKTVLPGLINAHVHILMEPVPDPFFYMQKFSTVKIAMWGMQNLAKQLKSGVTFVRDMGGYEFIEIELKKCLAEGFFQGADLLTSGKVLAMTGGHAYDIARECDGPDEVRKAAREQIRAGADIVKIMATGGILTPGADPGAPQLTYEEIKAAVEEARKAGRRTAAHAHGTTGIKNAVRAGITSIEHGMILDDEAIDLMLENETYLVPTLAAGYFMRSESAREFLPDYVLEKSKRFADVQLESFDKARKAGVKIAMGTDAGTPFNPHDGSAYELKLLVEAGMTPLEAIVAASRTAAELLGIADAHGTIEADKYADFIILGQDPLRNIDELLSVECVYKYGELVK